MLVFGITFVVGIDIMLSHNGADALQFGGNAIGFWVRVGRCYDGGLGDICFDVNGVGGRIKERFNVGVGLAGFDVIFVLVLHHRCVECRDFAILYGIHFWCSDFGRSVE